MYFLHFRCCCSVANSCPTLCNPMDYSTPDFPVLHYPLEFAQNHVIESMMPSRLLILCHPIVLLLSIFPNIRDFSNESVVHITWPKYWSVSFSISSSSEYSGLISLKIDWFDLLLSNVLSGIFYNITVWRHQLFGTLPSLWSSSHNRTWPLGRP